MLLFVVGIGSGSFERWRDIPWYGYISGLINVVIIYGVMVSIPKLGASTATTAIIVGQVGCAMIIDWAGLVWHGKNRYLLAANLWLGFDGGGGQTDVG